MLSSPAPCRVSTRLVTERLSDQLALLLRTQIDSGTLGPGDRLPTEQQLASTHGVSRTVVREAVHQLKSDEHMPRGDRRLQIRVDAGSGQNARGSAKGRAGARVVAAEFISIQDMRVRQ